MNDQTFLYNVEDITIGTRDVLRDHLAAACAHELRMTQDEWDVVTTYLSTIDKPRRRTHDRSNKHKSNIGESRVHRTLTGTVLMLMKLCSTPLLHNTWSAINLRKSS